jgi:biopolymer transport protein ExbD
MKFPRNSRLLRSPFDMAPFAAVLFLLVIFLMLGTFMPMSGLPLQLPVADDLPGTDQPAISVALDAHGRLYFADQMVTEPRLKSALKTAAQKSREPLTLVIQADKTTTYDQLVHLTLLARDAGITNALLATRPRAATASPGP